MSDCTSRNNTMKFKFIRTNIGSGALPCKLHVRIIKIDIIDAYFRSG